MGKLRLCPLVSLPLLTSRQLKTTLMYIYINGNLFSMSLVEGHQVYFLFNVQDNPKFYLSFPIFLCLLLIQNKSQMSIHILSDTKCRNQVFKAFASSTMKIIAFKFLCFLFDDKIRDDRTMNDDIQQTFVQKSHFLTFQFIKNNLVCLLLRFTT